VQWGNGKISTRFRRHCESDSYSVLGSVRGAVCLVETVCITEAVPAMKPEATAIGDPQDGLWKITLMFDGRRFCIPKFRYCTLDDTSLVISDHVLLWHNQSQRSCFAVIGYAGPGYY